MDRAAPPPPPADVAEAEAAARAAVRAVGEGVVAVSGGADSALVLALAAAEWPRGRCVALTSRSESLAPGDLDAARAQAAAAGVEHVVLAGSELDLEAFRKNAPDRCFHCKDSLYGAARAEAARRGLAWVADGTHAGDLGDHRPGLAAAERHGVRSPLLEAGLTKPWVRAVSRRLGLDTWDKPSESCLSSRFPYGTEVTREGLARVAAAEAAVRAEGFRTVRVRDHGPVARIELDPGELAAAAAPGVRERLSDALSRLGYDWVALDLLGYRSGSLNEPLRGR